MGRTEESVPMEGVSYGRSKPHSSSLRRLQTDAPIGSSRGPPLPSRSRDPRDPSQGSGRSFWNTVMDKQPAPPSTSSFHAGFSSNPASAGQSFHVPSSGAHKSSSSNRYACPECQKTYSSLSDLNSHREKSHNRASAPRPFRCTTCHKVFSQKSHLNQHIKTVHQNIRPYKCDVCDKAFGKRYDLSSHIDAVHAHERPHQCKYCDKKFAKRSNLTRHVEKLHPEKA